MESPSRESAANKLRELIAEVKGEAVSLEMSASRLRTLMVPRAASANVIEKPLPVMPEWHEEMAAPLREALSSIRSAKLLVDAAEL